jgi:hypothetical protein
LRSRKPETTASKDWLCEGGAARALLANLHHLQGKIGCHHPASGLLAHSFLSQVAGAGAQVQQVAQGGQAGALDHDAPPMDVLPGGHQPVHQVVAMGDAGKHAPHVDRPLFAGKVSHAHSRFGVPPILP